MLGRKGDIDTNIKFQFRNSISEILIKKFQTLNFAYINTINVIVFAVEVYLIFYLTKLAINKISRVKLSVSSKSRKYWRPP